MVTCFGTSCFFGFFFVKCEHTLCVPFLWLLSDQSKEALVQSFNSTELFTIRMCTKHFLLCESETTRAVWRILWVGAYSHLRKANAKVKIFSFDLCLIHTGEPRPTSTPLSLQWTWGMGWEPMYRKVPVESIVISRCRSVWMYHNINHYRLFRICLVWIALLKQETNKIHSKTDLVLSVAKK